MRSTVKFADLVSLSKEDRRDALASLYPFGGLMTDANRHTDGAERNKLIRAAFKEAETVGTLPAGLKISVRKQHHGSVTVEVQAVPFLILNPEHIRWQADNPHVSVWHDAPWEARDMLTDAGSATLQILESIASQWRYDKSDSMSDYFDTNYYLSVHFNYELERAQRNWILSVPRSVRIKPKAIAAAPARQTVKRLERTEAIATADTVEFRATVNGGTVETSPPPVAAGGAPLRIDPYSEKAFIVRGDTLTHKDRIKAAAAGLSPFWHRKAEGWIFPISRTEEVRASLADLLSEPPTNPPAGPDDGPGDGSKADQTEMPAPPSAPPSPTEVLGNRSKLHALADRIEERAREVLARNRLVNTARRARIAAGVEADAEAQLSLARTLRAIGEAQDAGTAGRLTKLSTVVQAELMRALIRRACWKAVASLPYHEQVERKGRRPSEHDLAHLEFPTGDDGHRLRAMEILTTGQLREAASAFVDLSSPSQKADPVKAALRDLIGRKIPGFFRTPASLARRVVERLDLLPGMSVLEPSAGAGDIADILAETVGKESVAAVEVNGTLRALLEAKGYALAGRDFFEHEGRYDRIAMNPPFEGLADINHVRRAFGMLKPGGRLVAIMSESPFFRSDGKAEEFRAWLDSVGGTSEQLPAGSFQESGTGVATRLVVIDA